MFKHIKSHYKDRISTLIFKNGNYFKDNTEHINEIVIPFLNTTKYNYEFKVNKNSFVDFKEYNSKLKNSKDYCYVKIYSKKNLLKDFVVPKLFEFLEENQVFTLNKFWFYIVYYDDFGGDHLRLRVKSKEKVLLQKFVSNMLNSNLVSNIIEDVYVDESERYGSTVLIKKVEEIFNLDSIFSINANVYNKQDDMILISTYNYFTSFYSESEFERMYIDNIDRNKLKKIYRDMESHIEELLLNFNKLDSNSKNLLEKISYKIKMYKDAVELCEERDELTNSKFDIVSSIIHMGFNRMFFDRNKEEEYFYVVLHYIFKNINKSKYVNKEGLRYGLFE